MKALRKKYALLFSRCSTSGLELHQNRCWASRWRLTCGQTAQHNCMQSSNLSTLLRSTCSWREIADKQTAAHRLSAICESEFCPTKKTSCKFSKLLLEDSLFAHRSIRSPVLYSKTARLSPSVRESFTGLPKNNFYTVGVELHYYKEIKNGPEKGKRVKSIPNIFLCIESTLYICICRLEATLHPQWLPNSRMSANHSSYHDTSLLYVRSPAFLARDLHLLPNILINSIFYKIQSTS